MSTHEKTPEEFPGFDDVRPDPFSFLLVEDLVGGSFTAWVNGLPPSERAAVVAWVHAWSMTEGERIRRALEFEFGGSSPASRPLAPGYTAVHDAWKNRVVSEDYDGTPWTKEHVEHMQLGVDAEGRVTVSVPEVLLPKGDPFVDFILNGPGVEMIPPGATLESEFAKLDRMLDNLDGIDKFGRSSSELRDATRALVEAYAGPGASFDEVYVHSLSVDEVPPSAGSDERRWDRGSDQEAHRPKDRENP